MSNRSRPMRQAGLAALLATAAPILAALAPAQALGHAAELVAEHRAAVAVTARYDTGTPMAEAQVTVFAPDDPASPWLQGLTDGDGRFVFVPDDQAGRWSVRVRQAGHGAIVHLDLDGPAATASATPVLATAGAGPTTPQKLIMAASLVWGCIGTALYFRRRGAGHAPS